MRGLKRGFVFKNCGCFNTSSVLRPLPCFKTETLEDSELYCEYEETLDILSAGELSLTNVSGKQACGTCRYILSKGAQRFRPGFHVTLLKDSADCCLVDCILYALDAPSDDSVYCRRNEAALTLAGDLRKKVISPFPNLPNCRILPVAEVLTLRDERNNHSAYPSANRTHKIIESRIGPVLDARNVHIYSLSRKFRCYALAVALCDTVHGIISLSTADEVPLLPKDRRNMFGAVSQRFFERRDVYRNGHWKLSEEIEAIPQRLWASFVLDMASNRQLAYWKVAASARGLRVSQVFPVNNDINQQPLDDLDNFAQRSLQSKDVAGSFPRSDFLLCRRTLKEQIAFSRSRLSAGPLKMTLSIAGIMESSASWTSVLHALGISVSYDATETYWKSLIAERENSSRDAFQNVSLDDRIVTVQTDK